MYDSRGYPRGCVKPATAVRILELGAHVGVGNPKRIRAIHPEAILGVSDETLRTADLRRF